MFSTRRCAHIGLAAAGVVLVSCLGILFAHTPRHEQIVLATPTGEQAPSFRLQDLQGESFDSAALRGKAVVVFFSSVHCETCSD